MNIFQSPSNNTNIVTVLPSFGTNMQSQNEFHLQPNSLFARKLHWKGCNPKPLQKEVDNHLDWDESTLQLR